MTLIISNSSGQFGISPFVVTPATGLGPYFTIQSAVTAAGAAGGGTVYVEPGTYTESIAFPANVSIVGAAPGDLQSAVILTGNQTFSATGRLSFQNMTLSATSGNTLSVSGANNSVVQVNNCAFSATAGSAVSGTSTGLNSSFTANNSTFTGSLSGLSFSGASLVSLTNCVTRTTGTGTTAFSLAGSNAAAVNNSSFFSQTANGVCVSIGSGCSLSSNKCSYSAGSGGGAAFYFPAATGSVSSLYDSFAIQDPAYYAKAVALGFGLLAYAYTTILSGASVIDPNITVTTFPQRPVVGPGISQWNSITTGQTMVVNQGYIVASGSLSLALPTTSARGDLLAVLLDAGTAWTITQAVGQQIRMGGFQTTLSTGSLASSAQGDSVTLVCTVANTLWAVLGTTGNILII